ncbi:MAG: hypothetical protein ACRCZB_05565 [Bacteroidales bacterium]
MNKKDAPRKMRYSNTYNLRTEHLEVVHVDDNSIHEVLEFCNGYAEDGYLMSPILCKNRGGIPIPHVVLRTPLGKVKVPTGCTIIKINDHVFYAMDGESFFKTFK